jgi:TolA-binding protein
MKAFTANGQTAEKAGKLGEAYTKYSQAASIPGVGQEDAAKAAAAIDREVRKQFQEAWAAYDAGRYTEAYTRYKNIARAYDGSKYAEEARTMLFRVKTADDEVREKINTRAKALAEEALAAEKAKDYVKAVRLYEEVLTTCRGSAITDSVRNRLAALKENPEAQAALNCHEWLAAADRFIEEGKTDKARELLNGILAKYPNSEWAKQAQERLKTLPPESAPATKEETAESGQKAGNPEKQVEPGK